MDDYIQDEEYKGFFYNNNEEEQKFYEGGAHFSYNELYKILDKLSKEEKNTNVFNFNNKAKSRNIIIEKDFSNLEKLNIKKEEEMM